MQTTSTAFCKIYRQLPAFATHVVRLCGAVPRHPSQYIWIVRTGVFTPYGVRAYCVPDARTFLKHYVVGLTFTSNVARILLTKTCI